MKAKEIAMNFFGCHTDDDICATLIEKNWHVMLNTEDSNKVEVLIDTRSGRVLSCILLDANLHRSS